MGGEKYGELILEAIDQLRKRKARPDLERICHMLERRHGLKNSEVNEQLSKLVSEGVVVKVDYKGNTSYRNAAKWVRTKSLFKPDFTSSDMAIAVQEAVSAISRPGDAGNSTMRCASLHDIEKYLMKRDTMCNMNIATLRSTLEREVANGNIRQVRTGEYISVKNLNIPAFDFSKTSPGKKLDDSVGDTKMTNNAHKRLRLSSSNTKDIDEELCCDYCLLTANSNHKGAPEGLLVCKDCHMKAHPTCVDYFGDAAKKVMSSPWQCADCKVCSVCSGSTGDDTVLVCNICDQGYHMKCHIPPLEEPPSAAKWTCGDCIVSNYFTLNDIKPDKIVAQNLDSSLAKVSKDEADVMVFKKCLETYPNIIPEVSNWTVDQVEMFFKHIGFPKAGIAFRDQDIDGVSLLLLKRSDVLTGLNLKLGLALKVYKHIKKIQTLELPSDGGIYTPD